MVSSKLTKLVASQTHLGQMMVDAYKSINKSFTPTKYDTETLIKVLDRDNDGLVKLSDVEALVIKLMCGER